MDETQLWYFWPHDHTLNQLPNSTTPHNDSTTPPAAHHHHHYHLPRLRSNSQSLIPLHQPSSARSMSFGSISGIPPLPSSNQSSMPSSNIPISFPSAASSQVFPAFSHPLQATPPQANYFHIPQSKDNGRDGVDLDEDYERDNCEECKKEQERKVEEEKKRKGDEALRKVLCTSHTHLEFCVVWTPRVALLKSIKRRIVVLIHSLSVSSFQSF